MPDIEYWDNLQDTLDRIRLVAVQISDLLEDYMLPLLGILIFVVFVSACIKSL